jgi:hypothetical protein
MGALLDLRLIPLFGFYLAVIFLLSTALRVRQYWAVLAIVFGMGNRWPHLLKLVRAHLNIFVTWATIQPLVMVLALWAANTLASQLLWPQAAEFTARDLVDFWPGLAVVLPIAAGMVAFDTYGVLWVGQLDRAETEKYLDQAEYWLRGWKAPVVRFVTLGYVNPRQMVVKEVRVALEDVGRLLNTTLWWVTVQTTLRIACGLALWGSYALHGAALAG